MNPHSPAGIYIGGTVDSPLIQVPQVPFPSLLSLSMAKVPCACGCKRNVSRSTKLNHLKGCGTTALQARVLAETKSLKIIADQQQEPQN